MPKRLNSNVINVRKKVEPTITRCDWVSRDPLYIAYHDNEWGKPEYDSLRLFEILCLESQQAGLSWITVLKKRDNYRKLFHNFNPYKVSKLNENDIEKILSDPGVIRHRGKLESIVNNSKCYMELEKDGIDFSEFIWGFVNKEPIINKWNSQKEVPTQTAISIALSKALKKKDLSLLAQLHAMPSCKLLD